MKKIDAHIHMHTCNLEQGTRFFDFLAEKGVEAVAIQELACYPHYSTFESIYALCLKKLYTDINIYVFGSLHEYGPLGEIPYEKQLENLIEMGCDGVKIIQMKPNVRKMTGKGINHPSYDKVFSLLEERGMPVLIHSKDPYKFWHKELMLPHQVERGWCYEGKGFESYETLHSETLEVLDKHPELNVILAHFFFLSDNRPEAERIMEKYPNVYFDITPGTEMYENFAKDIDGWREFFIKYQDRIIFGTDADDKTFEENADDLYRMIDNVLRGEDGVHMEHCYVDLEVAGLSLPEEVINKIYYKNFEKYAKTFAPVNMPAVKKYAAEMVNVLKDIDEEKEAVKLMENFLETEI